MCQHRSLSSSNSWVSQAHSILWYTQLYCHKDSKLCTSKINNRHGHYGICNINLYERKLYQAHRQHQLYGIYTLLKAYFFGWGGLHASANSKAMLMAAWLLIRPTTLHRLNEFPDKERYPVFHTGSQGWWPHPLKKFMLRIHKLC
jgi:hypothetical protein